MVSLPCDIQITGVYCWFGTARTKAEKLRLDPQNDAFVYTINIALNASGMDFQGDADRLSSSLWFSSSSCIRSSLRTPVEYLLTLGTFTLLAMMALCAALKLFESVSFPGRYSQNQ